MTAAKGATARPTGRAKDPPERARRTAAGATVPEPHAAGARGVPVVGTRARGAGVRPERLPRA